MVQVTLRVDDDLAHQMKRIAAARGESVNAFASRVLSAAVDPEFAGTDADRLRERLTAAGLMSPATGPRAARPDPDFVREVQRAIKPGKSFSDYVPEDRRV